VSFVHRRQHAFHCLKSAIDRGLRAADILNADPNQRLRKLALAFLKMLLDDREIRFLAAQLNEYESIEKISNVSRV
jgi:hypothetical protein